MFFCLLLGFFDPLFLRSNLKVQQVLIFTRGFSTRNKQCSLGPSVFNTPCCVAKQCFFWADLVAQPLRLVRSAVLSLRIWIETSSQIKAWNVYTFDCLNAVKNVLHLGNSSQTWSNLWMPCMYPVRHARLLNTFFRGPSRFHNTYYGTLPCMKV